MAGTIFWITQCKQEIFGAETVVMFLGEKLPRIQFPHLEESILPRNHQSFYSAPSLGCGGIGWSVEKVLLLVLF